MNSIFSTAVTPSRICLGTGSFGSEIDKADSFAVLDAFVAGGGNFIDTAHVYAAWLPNGWGASERTVGEWIRAHGVRDQVVLATKGGHPPLDDMALGRCGKGDLERDLDESLERLGVESVDVYWLHRDEAGRPVGEMIETLAGFVCDGRIRSYGASNWKTERIEAANAYARTHGLPPFAANQPGWSLAERATAESTVSPMLYLDEPMRQWHIAQWFPLVAYSSQAGGYFGADNVAWARSGCVGPISKRREYDSAANRQRLIETIALADWKACTPNQIALAYLLHQPFPVFPIIGTGRPEHVREALEALQVALTEKEVGVLTGEKL